VTCFLCLVLASLISVLRFAFVELKRKAGGDTHMDVSSVRKLDPRKFLKA
jgi:hypothetical protein